MDPDSSSIQQTPEEVTQISEKHINENASNKKDRRKGKPIPGFAREVILKVRAEFNPTENILFAFKLFR